MLIAAGCAEVKVPVTYTRPAAISMAGRDVVVIDPIVGPGGELMTSRLKESLQAAHFTILDRDAALKGLSQEKALSQSGDAAPSADKAQIKRAGVKITGKVLKHGSTGGYQRINTSSGAMYYGEGTTEVVVAFDVLDLQTTETIATKSVRGQKAYKTDAVSDPSALAGAGDYDGCYADVVEKFMALISVHEEAINVSMYEVGKVPQNQVGIAAFTAREYAQAASEFDAASAAASSIPDIKPEDKAHIRHNAGLAYEFGLKYPKALECYNEAQRLAPDAAYTASIIRAKQRVQEAKALDEQVVSVK